jgi:hypothetical protein
MNQKSERRNMTREPTLMEGRIAYGKWFARTVPCLVTETSSRGARIWTTYAVRLPEKFHLHIGHDDDAGRSAYAVWRTGAERGLCFERTAAARRLLLPLPTLLMRWRGLPGAGALP